MRHTLTTAGLVLSALLAAISVLPAATAAQSLEPGVRIRVTQSSGFRQQGTLQAIDLDSARLVTARGAAVAIPVADVARMEVSLGRQRQFWKHLGLTVGGLTALGGAAGAIAYSRCVPEDWFDCMFAPNSRMEAAAQGAILAGALGIPVGIVVGAAVRRERWAPVSHPAVAPRRVSVRPFLGRGAGLAASLTLE